MGVGETVAVSVTDAPAIAGFGDAVSVVVEADAPLIVTVTVLEVEVASVPLPLYAAVMLSAPSGRLLIASVATPFAPTVTMSSTVPEPHSELSCAPVVWNRDAP